MATREYALALTYTKIDNNERSFLDLPYDIRANIYRYIFSSTTPTIWNLQDIRYKLPTYTPFPAYHFASLRNGSLPPIFHTNRALYADVLRYFYTHTTFCFTVNNEPWRQRFNLQLCPPMLTYLSRVHIDYTHAQKFLFQSWYVGSSSFGATLLSHFPSLRLLEMDYDCHACLLQSTLQNVANLVTSRPTSTSNTKSYDGRVPRTTLYLTTPLPMPTTYAALLRHQTQCKCPTLTTSSPYGSWSAEVMDLLAGIQELRFTCLADQTVQTSLQNQAFGRFMIVKTSENEKESESESKYELRKTLSY